MTLKPNVQRFFSKSDPIHWPRKAIRFFLSLNNACDVKTIVVASSPVTATLISELDFANSSCMNCAAIRLHFNWTGWRLQSSFWSDGISGVLDEDDWVADPDIWSGAFTIVRMTASGTPAFFSSLSAPGDVSNLQADEFILATTISGDRPALTMDKTSSLVSSLEAAGD
jgi:hypothetical protein